jgi:catechol 2,3-dioxygenase-like lactoylglutathione lyase family enzyme
MKFGYTIVYVADVEKTINFYQQAFKLKVGFVHKNKQYGELATGDTKLAFAAETLAEGNGVEFIKNHSNKLPAGIEVTLVTNDVVEAYKHAVTAGAIAVKEPLRKPWGQMVAYVRDLNGILIELCSPI